MNEVIKGFMIVFFSLFSLLFNFGVFLLHMDIIIKQHFLYYLIISLLLSLGFAFIFILIGFYSILPDKKKLIIKIKKNKFYIITFLIGFILTQIIVYWYFNYISIIFRY